MLFYELEFLDHLIYTKLLKLMIYASIIAGIAANIITETKMNALAPITVGLKNL